MEKKSEGGEIVSEITMSTKHGGSFYCYVETPNRTPAPAVIVIQEIFGITDWLKSVVQDLASKGFLAVAPDLFWRMEPRVNLKDTIADQFEKALELYEKFDQDQGVSDLNELLAFVRAQKQCNGKIGSVGFCLGGKMSYFMSCRSDIDCSVSYYGVGIENHLEEAATISKPLMLHVAGSDPFVPPSAQEKIIATLGSNPLATINKYEGLDHGFARVGGMHYDKTAAELANLRTVDFLNKHLSGALASVWV